MKIVNVFRIGAIWAAMLAMALPVNVLGAAPASETHLGSVVRDVALGQNGVLNGRIVDAVGKATPNASVLLHRDGRLVARTTTNADGQFSARNLTSGVYQLTAANQQRTYRVWNAQTAPPAAASAIQLTNGEIVRGQWASSCSDCAACGDASCTGGCGGSGCTDSCGGGCGLGGGCTGSGGFGGHGAGGLLGSPLLIAAGIAAAIAIPIALDDDDAS